MGLIKSWENVVKFVTTSVARAVYLGSKPSFIHVTLNIVKTFIMFMLCRLFFFYSFIVVV